MVSNEDCVKCAYYKISLTNIYNYIHILLNTNGNEASADADISHSNPNQKAKLIENSGEAADIAAIATTTVTSDTKAPKNRPPKNREIIAENSLIIDNLNTLETKDGFSMSIKPILPSDLSVSRINKEIDTQMSEDLECDALGRLIGGLC